MHKIFFLLVSFFTSPIDAMVSTCEKGEDSNGWLSLADLPLNIITCTILPTTDPEKELITVIKSLSYSYHKEKIKKVRDAILSPCLSLFWLSQTNTFFYIRLKKYIEEIITVPKVSLNTIFFVTEESNRFVLHQTSSCNSVYAGIMFAKECKHGDKIQIYNQDAYNQLYQFINHIDSTTGHLGVKGLCSQLNNERELKNGEFFKLVKALEYSLFECERYKDQLQIKQYVSWLSSISTVQCTFYFFIKNKNFDSNLLLQDPLGYVCSAEMFNSEDFLKTFSPSSLTFYPNRSSKDFLLFTVECNHPSNELDIPRQLLTKMAIQ